MTDTYWAVFDGYNELQPMTLRSRRKASILSIAGFDWRWLQLKQVGYRCRKVTVKVKP